MHTAVWIPESEGPTAGTETADPLEFLARVLVHIPDKGQLSPRGTLAGTPTAPAGYAAGRSPPPPMPPCRS